jgi:hypothetical protein
MAPLPLFHRPLSQDNSRETSLSSGRGGGRSTGPDTSGSGSGVSLPMRAQVLNNNTKSCTPTTPDTPSSTNMMVNAASSDYLIPLTTGLQGGAGATAAAIRPNQSKRSVSNRPLSHTTAGATPVSSPSDEPASCSDEEEHEAANLLSSSAAAGAANNIKTLIYQDDQMAETSFTCSPPKRPLDRAGYAIIPSNGRPIQSARRRANDQQGSKGSSGSSGGSSAGHHRSSRSSPARRSSGSIIEPPLRTTSVIQPVTTTCNHLLPSPPIEGLTTGMTSPMDYAPPPPPPRGYSDSTIPAGGAALLTRDLASPVLPPLPPLPPGSSEAEEFNQHPLMSPLDVASLRQTKPTSSLPQFMAMDSPRDVIGGTLYTITRASADGGSSSIPNKGSLSPPSDAPPSEISV